MVVFSNRVRAIGHEITESEHRERRSTRDAQKALEKDLVKFFIRGLHWVIEARIGEAENLEKATAEAIEIERDFACYEPEELNDTIKIITEKKTNSPREDKVYLVDSKNVELCQICNRRGHIALNCWQYTGKPSNIQNRQPLNTWAEPRGSSAPTQWTKDRQYVHRQNTTFTNNQTTKFFRYCKKEGHVMENCRKLAYNNNQRNAQEQAGNSHGPRQQGARRETDFSRRPDENQNNPQSSKDTFD